LRTVNRLIAASPALLAREQQAFTRSTRALADLLARLAAEVRTLTRQAIALLEHGLGDYGADPPPRR
jgi:hypothetical protein